MARPRIAMSADEVAAFLARKHTGVVGSRDAAGAPDGEPARVAWTDGSLAFTVARAGAAHRNLLADPRVVVSVEEFPSYAAIKGVAVRGRAVLVAETEAAVTFRIAAAHVESFDFARMRPA